MARGDWQVTRFCCTSGMCIDCRAVANGTERKRVVHADGLTKAKAQEMAKNWSNYGALASKMPEASDACPGCGCLPGDGLTPGCSHLEGCGFWAEQAGN